MQHKLYVSKELSGLKSKFECIDAIILSDNSQDCDYYIGSGEDLSSNYPSPRLGMIISNSNGHANFVLEAEMTCGKTKYSFYRRNNHVVNISFIIQGLDTCTMFEFACVLFTHGKIIKSTWSCYDLKQVQDHVKKNNIHNNQNIYYQVYTTLEGLKRVDTKYVIKVRSDEFYADFSIFIKTMLQNENKVCCSNIYLRKVNKYAFHMSDHIIGGMTKEVLKMFKNAHDILNDHITKDKPFRNCIWCPEQVLAIAYLMNYYNINTINLDTCRELMQRHFVSVDITTFKRFSVVYTCTKPSKGPPRQKITATNANFNDHKDELIDLYSIHKL